SNLELTQNSRVLSVCLFLGVSAPLRREEGPGTTSETCAAVLPGWAAVRTHTTRRLRHDGFGRRRRFHIVVRAQRPRPCRVDRIAACQARSCARPGPWELPRAAHPPTAAIRKIAKRENPGH